MAVETVVALKSVLDEGNFHLIIGTAESDWIDFKSETYDLENSTTRLSAKGKAELCKDVAAMANSGGGCLLLGVETASQQTRGVERARSIRAIRTHLIDVGDYRRVLASGVYPPPAIDLRWYHDKGSNECGLLLIEIGYQQASHFLAKRIWDQTTDRFVESAFGMPVRYGDQTIWRSAKHIQAIFRTARPAEVSISPDTGLARVEPLGALGGWCLSRDDAALITADARFAI